MLECKEYETDSVQVLDDVNCKMCGFSICKRSIAHRHKERKEYLCPLCWDDMRRIENNEKV